MARPQVGATTSLVSSARLFGTNNSTARFISNDTFVDSETTTEDVRARRRAQRLLPPFTKTEVSTMLASYQAEGIVVSGAAATRAR